MGSVMPENEDLAFRGHPRNIQYTTKVARLLNQTETGIARAVSDDSENFLERQYGQVFVVADSSFTSDFYDIGEVLVDTVQREFYADLNRSVPDSFEHALTVTNQTLADLAAEGQSDWVGKLNAVICVLHENEIHVSKVGTAEAYLVRGHSSTQITEGLTDDEGGQTAKTFLNVASGQLEVGDKLVIATNELFKHFSLKDLQRTLYLHPPARAIKKLADTLTAGQAPGRLASIVVELTTIDLISAEPVTNDPDEIILSAPRRHFETLQKLRPFRKDTPISQGLDRAKKHWDKRLQPQIKRAATGARHQVVSWNARRKGEAPPPPPPHAAAGTPATVRQPDATPDHTPADSTTPAASSQLTKTLSNAAKAVGQALRPVGQALNRAWQKSGIPHSKVWQNLLHRLEPLTSRLKAFPFREQFAGSRRVLYRNLILAAALVLVLSLALSINAAENRKAEAKIHQRIRGVEELQAKAEASYIFKDTNGARTQLAEAKKQADGLSKERLLKNEIARLRQSLAVSTDRINNVVTVPNAPLADLRETAKKSDLTRLAQSGTTLYAVGESTPVYSFNQANKETRTSGTPAAGSGKFVSSTTTSNGDVLFLTDKPTILELNTSSGELSDLPVSTGGAWEPGTAIDAVQQNAFILDPAKNQVWRHARTLAGYNKGEPYFAGTVDLKGAVDVVTGAQVFVLKADGSVKEFAGGNEQPNFKLQAPPAPGDKVVGATALGVNFTSNNLYVTDPKEHRVLEFNAAGDYTRQFKNDAFAGLTDIVVDDKTGQLYVLAGNRIFQINLGG